MLSIVPVPKQIIISDGIYCLPEKVSVLFSKIASTQRLKKALEEILDTFLICDSTTNSGDIVIERKELSPESYQLDITPNKIIIKASDETGVYYAIKTLKQIINTTSKKNIPVLSIFDEPDLKVRGVMQDVSRGKVPTLESLKKEIDLLSDLKYNHFEVYIEGTSFEYKKYSEYQKHGNYLTQEEYKELEKYANEHFIDLVPNMNGFGHMGEWLTIPQFEHLRETDGLFYIWGSYRKSATLDASNAESAEFVKMLYSELLDISNSNYFNMDFDEPFELGTGKSKELCLEKGKEQVFKEYYDEVVKVVKEAKKRPMIWADVIINHPEIIEKFDDDAILIDWGYNLDYPFDKHGKVLEKFKKKFIMAPGTSTWGVATGRFNDMLYSVKNAATAAIKYHGEGIIVTDWGDFGHIQYPLFSYPGFIYAAMCAWNNECSYIYKLKNYLKFIFKEDLAQIILDMENYTRLEGDYRSYGSKLFSPIIQTENALNEIDKVTYFKEKMKYNYLSISEYKNLEIELESIEKRIKLIDHSPEKDEIVCAHLLLKTLLHLNGILSGNNCFDELGEVQRDFSRFLELHKENWCLRNKKEGFTFSEKRITSLLEIIKKIKERGSENE